MSEAALRFHHDYVDPASYLVHASLARLGALDRVEHHPFELRKSSAPPIDPTDSRWQEYLREMAGAAEEAGIPFDPPSLVPWTAKAHELALHAAEIEPSLDIHSPLYDAHFLHGRDIGRVDMLVEIAEQSGLDPTEAKAVLDVDRFSLRIEEEREAAVEAGIRGVPTLALGSPSDGGEVLEGFHTEEEIGTFLQRATGGS